jgi:hypothetical protein
MVVICASETSGFSELHDVETQKMYSSYKSKYYKAEN